MKASLRGQITAISTMASIAEQDYEEDEAPISQRYCKVVLLCLARKTVALSLEIHTHMHMLLSCYPCISMYFLYNITSIYFPRTYHADSFTNLLRVSGIDQTRVELILIG